MALLFQVFNHQGHFKNEKKFQIVEEMGSLSKVKYKMVNTQIYSWKWIQPNMLWYILLGRMWKDNTNSPTLKGCRNSNREIARELHAEGSREGWRGLLNLSKSLVRAIMEYHVRINKQLRKDVKVKRFGPGSRFGPWFQGCGVSTDYSNSNSSLSRED